MKKAFAISIAVFGVFLFITVILTISNAADIPYDDPRYANYPVLQQFVGIIKILDAIDLQVTILSAISSVVTFIGKSVRKMGR